MTVETDQPGMQVYTANGLTQRPGKQGTTMGPGCGLPGDTAVPQWHSPLRIPLSDSAAGEFMHRRNGILLRTVLI